MKTLCTLARTLRIWIHLAYTDITLKQDIKYTGSPVSGRIAPKNTEQIIWMVVADASRAARYPLWFNMPCLRKAIAIHKTLPKKGIATDISFAMKKINRRFIAHAWLKTDSLTIDPSSVSQEFVELRKNL